MLQRTNYIFCNGVPPTLWQQFVPFLFGCPQAQSQVCKEMFFAVWCKRTRLACTEPLTPTSSNICELRRLITQHHLTKTFVTEWKQIPEARFQHLVESGACVVVG